MIFTRRSSVAVALMVLALHLGCGEPDDPEVETRELRGTPVDEEADGTKCLHVGETVTVGTFDFKRLPYDEEPFDNQIGLTDCTAFVLVEPRQTAVIAELESMGFSEVGANEIPRCTFEY